MSNVVSHYHHHTNDHRHFTLTHYQEAKLHISENLKTADIENYDAAESQSLFRRLQISELTQLDGSLHECAKRALADYEKALVKVKMDFEGASIGLGAIGTISTGVVAHVEGYKLWPPNSFMAIFNYLSWAFLGLGIYSASGPDPQIPLKLDERRLPINRLKELLREDIQTVLLEKRETSDDMRYVG